MKYVDCFFFFIFRKFPLASAKSIHKTVDQAVELLTGIVQLLLRTLANTFHCDIIYIVYRNYKFKMFSLFLMKQDSVCE